MERENPNAMLDALGRQLALEQQTFFLEPFQFTWWLRGGEPGSPSDHLTLEGERGSIKAIYLRAGFDPTRQPPVFSETFTGAVHHDQAAAILKPLFASSLFRTSDKQDEGEMRDGRKESWSLKARNAEYNKTLFEPFPPELEHLQALCAKTAEDIARVYRR